MEKTTKNITEWKVQKKAVIVNKEVIKQSKECIDLMELKEDVLKMIAVINPKEYGLLKALQDAIINGQAEYYYNESMEYEEIRRKVLDY